MKAKAAITTHVTNEHFFDRKAPHLGMVRAIPVRVCAERKDGNHYSAELALDDGYVMVSITAGSFREAAEAVSDLCGGGMVLRAYRDGGVETYRRVPVVKVEPW